ncbi:MAG: hypothetical protein QOG84_2910 [Sphingomonadales bacterium]|jgi:hypothetical protein|nr:hypothetical protein [Sphingomonadales bacterium]
MRDVAWLARFRLRARLDRRFGVPAALDAPGPQSGPPPAAALPRRLWLYWEQGWDEAPELVRLCRRSWERHHPDWEIACLDSETAAALVPRAAWEPRPGMRANHKANLLRLHLLAGQGGVWADATTFCAEPLDAWLPPLMGSGFFAFARPGRDRLLSTWLLAATPGHALVEKWLAACRRYWRLTAQADFYFWLPYLFADLCRRDRAAREIWAAVPRRSADPSHAVQRHFADRGETERVAALLAAGIVPVHKLDWRLPVPPAGARTPLASLLEHLDPRGEAREGG